MADVFQDLWPNLWKGWRILGFSDIRSLLCYLAANLHGPEGVQFE